MKSLFLSFTSGVLFLGISVNGWTKDPKKEDPQVVISAIAAATKGESVRIVKGAGGYNIYGPNGKSGSFVEWGSGYMIYYNGKSHSVVKNAGEWTIY